MPIVNDGRDRPLFIFDPKPIPCPQHKDATERCLFCGEKDGATKFGSLYCIDCQASGVQGTVRREVFYP